MTNGDGPGTGGADHRGPGAPRSPGSGGPGGGGHGRILPMFPLQAVLFPHGLLPLHVFEPRYRQMTRDCMAGDRRFGVVLIARGSEVGGGDSRCSVGTVARIDQAANLPDGRFALVTSGRERLVVRQWLADDPYPRAEVTTGPAEDPAPTTASVQRATAAVRRAHALRSELGHGPALPATLRLADDPAVAAWQVCDLAPVGAADRQRLLEEPDAERRLDLLCRLVEAAADDLARLLAGG